MTSMCITQDQEDLINILTYTENIICVIASGLVLATYMILPNLRKSWAMRSIAYLNISNFLFNITVIISTTITDDTEVMTIINFLNPCLSYSTTIWPLIFGINLYQIIVNHHVDLSRYELLHLFIGFIFPVILVSLWEVIDSMDIESELIMEITQYYAPMFLILLLFICIYIKLMRTIKVLFKEEDAKKFIKQVLPYPIIAVTATLSLCASQLVGELNGCYTLLANLLPLIKYSQSIFDAIIYGFNPTMKEELKNYYNSSKFIKHDKHIFLQTRLSYS